MTIDTNYDHVSLLVPFTGTNNNTVAEDFSLNKLAVVLNGTAFIDTSVADPFGNHNGVLSVVKAGDSRVSVADTNSALSLGTGNFTIEGFVYLKDTSSYYSRLMIFGGAGTGFGLYVNGDSLFASDIVANGAGWTWSIATVPIASWVHIAVVRDGTTVTVWVNGTSVASYSITSGTTYNTAGFAYFGGLDTGWNTPCYLSNWRLTKGIARTISVPTSAFYFPSYAVSIDLTESIAATDFIACVYKLDTGVLLNRKVIQAGVGLLLDTFTSNPVFITFMPQQGDAWKPSTVYIVNDLVFPTDPITTPHYYKRLVNGTSGATEPTWATSGNGQCNDGIWSNAWERVDGLSQPISIGPMIPI